MQWLVDLVLEAIGPVGGFPTGSIILWHGTIYDVPDGWVFCNGDNDTPDLRDKFIVCKGPNYDVGDTGGATTQTHLFEGSGSGVSLVAGSGLGGSGKNDPLTNDILVTGQTAPSSILPPYYALVFIMKT